MRTGIHLGDVAVGSDGDLYGDGVNTAQRIQTVAQPGQIVVSGDVWRQLRNRSTFRFEPLGERELKGVEALDLYVVTEVARPRPAVVPDTSVATEPAPSIAPRERSIAVLPFMNLSSDPENEYFSDGITEEILNALVKVSDLKVASRTSSFAFKGHQGDVREIADRHRTQLPRSVKLLLRGAGAGGRSGRQLASYLLFESGFCGELIDLGYTDAMAQRERLRAFLAGAPVPALTAPPRVAQWLT